MAYTDTRDEKRNIASLILFWDRSDTKVYGTGLTPMEVIAVHRMSNGVRPS